MAILARTAGDAIGALRDAARYVDGVVPPLWDQAAVGARFVIATDGSVADAEPATPSGKRDYF